MALAAMSILCICYRIFEFIPPPAGGAGGGAGGTPSPLRAAARGGDGHGAAWRVGAHAMNLAYSAC